MQQSIGRDFDRLLFVERENVLYSEKEKIMVVAFAVVVALMPGLFNAYNGGPAKSEEEYIPDGR